MQKYLPMIDGALELQAAVTKTADFNGAWLDLGDGYAPGGLGEPIAAVVDVSALDHTTGDETYALKLQQTDADVNGAAVDAHAEDIGPSVAVTATGLAVVKGLVTSRFVRLVLDVNGTTPRAHGRNPWAFGREPLFTCQRTTLFRFTDSDMEVYG